jgi:hypothetical protein
MLPGAAGDRAHDRHVEIEQQRALRVVADHALHPEERREAHARA